MTRKKTDSSPETSEYQLCLTEKQVVEAKVNKKLTSEEKIDLYRLMMRIRRFEERAVQSYQRGKIGGFCHTYIGQESVAVGTLSVLKKEDQAISAYRDHGQGLALGMNMNECMAELYGKWTGCSKGKGGSMHYFAPEKRFWGGHGIVGAQTPLGAGIAFALKYQGTQGVCLCYLGDGAVNQGAYHEALNLAALWELPVIFIIENNQYSMGTSQERSSAGNPLAKRAEGYGMRWAKAPGNDLATVRAYTGAALDYVRETSRPMILEFDTYRYRGHSMSDPDQTYRSKEEIAEYKKSSDPIDHYASILEKEKVLTAELKDTIDKEAKAEASDAADYAEESPFPPPEDIMKDIYWETDNPDHKTSEGTLFFNSLND